MKSKPYKEEAREKRRVRAEEKWFRAFLDHWWWNSNFWSNPKLQLRVSSTSLPLSHVLDILSFVNVLRIWFKLGYCVHGKFQTVKAISSLEFEFGGVFLSFNS